MKKDLPLPTLSKIIEPHELIIIKKGIRIILPHLVKLSIISSLLFFPATTYAANISAQDIIKSVNKQRSKFALLPLRENHLLTLAAYKKAQDMFDNNYFAHVSPQGTEFYQWITDAGYDFIYAGENLAKNFNTTESVMKAWLKSPTHRENILDSDFCEIGISTNEYIDGSTVIVQFFGCRKSETPISAQSTDSGYSITDPAPKEIIKPKKTGAAFASETPANTNSKREKSRPAVIGLATLLAVAAITMEKRRHYYHIYKIPITITPTISRSYSAASQGRASSKQSERHPKGHLAE